jgi:hypothetical protein
MVVSVVPGGPLKPAFGLPGARNWRPPAPTGPGGPADARHVMLQLHIYLMDHPDLLPDTHRWREQAPTAAAVWAVPGGGFAALTACEVENG